MEAHEELIELAARFEAAAAPGADPAIRDPIQARIDACGSAARAFSGSWLGYHARVYQKDLRAVPGAAFDSSWGLKDWHLGDGRGEWLEYDGEQLKTHLRSASSKYDFSKVETAVASSTKELISAKADLISILTATVSGSSDKYLGKLLENAEKLNHLSLYEAIAVYRPSGKFASADSVALMAGLHTPPHIEVLAEVAAMATVFDGAQQGADIARQAASHLERTAKRHKNTERVGTNVFIGHGRSPLWRELKEFVQERLRLPADEFNRVPVAGFTNIARLSEMLDAAAIAFVIMTAEDETHEGKMQARMNVIHEVGLFQGRLGFERAIIMLEEGCEDFSNVQGLGQIRFPKGNIKAAFEDVRAVTERELSE
jgi:predicted nucleotide-binding protein